MNTEGPTAEGKTHSVPFPDHIGKRKPLFLRLFFSSQDHTDVLTFLDNHDKRNFSNAYLGFDLHFDMQKLIPQTQLLMCRIQFKKKKRRRRRREKQRKQEGRHCHPRWCSPFLRSLNQRKVTQQAARVCAMRLAQFCTHLLHHLLIFVIEPRVVLGTEQSNSTVQYTAY